MNTNDLNLELDLDINISILLNILDKTTRKYMDAFEVGTAEIDFCSEVLVRYQGFKKITVYYMNDKGECISYVAFSFDWEKYRLTYQTNDPDVLIKRKTIVSASPEQILNDACEIINQKIKALKAERNFKYTRIAYTYADKISELEKIEIRKKGKLVPFNKNSIKYSKEMYGYITQIESSITENTLEIAFVM